MKAPLFVILFFLTMIACRQDPGPAASDEPGARRDLRTAIIGRWDTSLVIVSMKSVNNSGLDGTVEVVKNRNSEAAPGGRVQSVFKDDGTYLSEYRDENKRLVIKSSGKWTTEGKTLILQQDYPKQRLLKYQASVDQNYAEFKCTVDYDNDGQNDDFLYCLARRSG